MPTLHLDILAREGMVMMCKKRYEYKRYGNPAISLCCSAVVDTAVSENRCSWLLVCCWPAGINRQQRGKQHRLRLLVKVIERELAWTCGPVSCLRVLCLLSTGVTINVMIPWLVSAGLTRSPALEGVVDPLCSSEVAVASGRNWSDNKGKWSDQIGRLGLCSVYEVLCTFPLCSITTSDSSSCTS
jgi:hypothetical protein